MNLFIFMWLAQATWPSVFAIYFLEMREVFKPPEKLPEDSYFGYSITYDQEYKKLVISAPKENNIGEVYDCDIENKTCTPIVKNITRFSPLYTHDYWFGATVKAGPDFVMMCAPRFAAYYYRFDNNVTWGKCFAHTKGKLVEKNTIRESERIKDSPSPMEDNMDSFGWSIDVASDDSVIVGGPGMYRGRAMIYKPHVDYPIFIKKSQRTPEFNFGYSVSSGTFINNSISYAVGSTYGKNGFGEVAFFENVKPQAKLRKKVDTDVVGSMFGAVLCAAQLTGRKSDLLVGAPTYGTQSDHNLGAVYVYISAQLDDPPTFFRKIVGKPGSQFGSAIISLGDLNGDKRHEIAIGAPFENSNGKVAGAVYLYSGADLISQKTEMELKYLQRIEPEPSYANSFGMSLTSLLDYDQNGCKELAIGSPFTDSVLLLRCMASVTVTTTVNFPKLQERSDQTKFKFDVCLNVEYPSLPETVIALLLTTVDMTHSHAKLVSNSPAGFTFKTSLNKTRREYCTKVPFILPLHGNYETEINIHISTILLNDPRNLKDFNSSRVILSDQSVLNHHETLWAADCSGKTCVPNLELTTNISFKYDDHKYIIGSSKFEYINLSVLNTGEVAYDPCVRINILGVPVFKHPTSCKLEKSSSDTLKCKPSNPLQHSEFWDTGKIFLEMTHLNNLDRNVEFNVLLLSNCKETGNYTSIVTPVTADENSIVVKGETDIGMYVNMTEEDIKVNGKKMQHIYSIVNNGEINWVEVQCQVKLQKLPYIRYSPAPVQLYFSENKPLTECPLLAQHGVEMIYLCTIEKLIHKKSAKIFIPMDIVPGSLEGIVKDTSNATIMSTVKVLLIDNKYRQESILTTIMLQEAKVPLELIIIAVCVGIFIVFIIAVILYRVGFLRRQKKEKLRRLQKSVKRQTILRQSLTPPQSPADEQKPYIDAVEEDLTNSNARK